MIKIYGRVQMVLFRDSTRRKAKKLGLNGWVRNESDGSVLVLAQGEEKALKELIDWCYNGPVLAKVDKVEVKYQELSGNFDGFRIEY